MQNNRFCKALIIKWLRESFIYEKIFTLLLHCFRLSSVAFLVAVNEHKKANQRSLQALVRFYFV